MPGQIRWVDQENREDNDGAASRSSVDEGRLGRHWTEGTRHFQRGAWREAVREFDAALAISPREARILVARGWAHAEIGEEQQALNDFRQALTIEQLAEAHIGIAELAKAALPRLNRTSEVFGALGQGQYHYQQAIAMRPDDAYLHFGLATLQYLHHHNQYATPALALQYPLATVQRAIRMDPEFADALLLEAMIRSELKQEAEAARAADRALALQPLNPEAHYVRGLVMSRTADRPRAPAYARRALELDPDNPRYARAVDEWQQAAPVSISWGNLAGVLSLALLGAFLTADTGPYTGPPQQAYDPWGPSGYLRQWHTSIMLNIR